MIDSIDAAAIARRIPAISIGWFGAFGRANAYLIVN